VERQLKERLVGAAVLMAMAVILIPEMLSGARRTAAPPADSAAQPSESNRKRYTIDLNAAQPPAAAPEISNIEPAPIEAVPPPEAEEAPPPEVEAVPLQDSEEVPEPSAPVATLPAERGTAAASVEAPGPAANAPVESVLPPAPVATPPQTTTPAPAAAVTATGSTRRWAVQLIAYDNRARAQRMAEDLRESNYAAFVMPVQAATGTLYRVRVGPFATRAEADSALRKLKTVTSDPTVVAQP
jgi:DedD protein